MVEVDRVDAGGPQGVVLQVQRAVGPSRPGRLAGSGRDRAADRRGFHRTPARPGRGRPRRLDVSRPLPRDPSASDHAAAPGSESATSPTGSASSRTIAALGFSRLCARSPCVSQTNVWDMPEAVGSPIPGRTPGSRSGCLRSPPLVHERAARAPRRLGRGRESEVVARDRGRLDAVIAGAARRTRRARRGTSGSLKGAVAGAVRNADGEVPLASFQWARTRWRRTRWKRIAAGGVDPSVCADAGAGAPGGRKAGDLAAVRGVVARRGSARFLSRPLWRAVTCGSCASTARSFGTTAS